MTYQVSIVSSHSLHLPVEQVLLHLHPPTQSCQTSQLVHICVPGDKIGNVVGDLLCSLEDGVPIHHAPHQLQVKDLLSKILRTPHGGERKTTSGLRVGRTWKKFPTINSILSSTP
eukprot:TRINITY_DN36801_c0_g1_i1.p1 TRINITY_DN36801_c0_g1~~TRINITY_DN36801_c0_g1_i1.p1  ORF type:complete len:115 (+),score=21.20 TRINITY_DN36801_c0_g1_i1:80-424(+)